MALLAVLQQGYSGTFDALARYTGLPCHTVRQTLDNMRRAGVVQAQRDATCHQPQRARAIYCLARAKESFDALRYACQVWR
jgi:predicted ArsR family transcriptional regulator